MKFSIVAPFGFCSSQYGSADSFTGGFAGTAPSIVTRPETFAALDGSTVLAFGGGPLGAARSSVLHAADNNNTAHPAKRRKPLCDISLCYSDLSFLRIRSWIQCWSHHSTGLTM